MPKNQVTANGGPATPKLKRLEELLEFLTNQKLDNNLPPARGMAKDEVDEHNDILQECVEALDWTHTMLSNRKFYMKRQQLKKKITLNLAKEALSRADLTHIEKQAQELAETMIADEKGDVE